MAARRSVTLLALALVAAALATAAGAAVTDKGDPKRALTPADQARARAIALRASDLPPGWAAERSKAGGGSLTCPGFAPDQSDLTRTGRATSPDFTRADGAFVSSVVGIFLTADQAQASWDRIVRPGLLGCLVSLFERGAASKTAKVTIVSKGPFRFPRLAPRSAAFRIVGAVKTQGITVKAYLDIILLGADRADVATIFVGVGRPLEAAIQGSLARTLAARLRS